MRTRGHTPSRQAGQAMVESILALILLCLVFFVVYEYAHLLVAHTVLDYAAARAARARAVGFNDFMVTKTVRVATLATAGRDLLKDNAGKPLSTGTLVSRMGAYLARESEADVRAVLDFEFWNPARLGWSCVDPGGDTLTLTVWQRRPLYGEDDEADATLHRLEGRAEIEDHAGFYLQ